MKVLAVVIGNNDYFDPDKLKNAVNDAQAMETVFQRLGYTVMSGYDCNDCTYAEIMRKFDNNLANYDASVFYYAGHGFQEDGENYLPSVECQVSSVDKYELGFHSIQLSDLLNIYRKYDKKTHIVILDACRVRSGNRGGNDSFAPVNAPQGTFIAFSTSPNCAAKDSMGGDHSVYTAALLEYMGRENIAVEALFKMVRRTVAHHTNNKQIPWEHTSLIGDFQFNTGQMVASPQIPYKESVVRDAEYDGNDAIVDLIKEIRISNYNRQNPAIDKLCAMSASSLDKNQQFIFGRNLLQSSEWAFSAQRFMNSLDSNLRKYLTKDGDNHVLNGMLFEIYFDSYGEFRSLKLKRHFFDEIMALRKKPDYAKSFQFIRTVIYPYRDNLIYMIPEDDAKLDVDIVAKDIKVTNAIGEETIYSLISSISVNNLDITNKVKIKFKYAGKPLLDVITDVTDAPKDAVVIHTNITLQYLVKFEDENDDPFA